MTARVTTLGVLLKHLRTDAGLTQEELAVRAGLSAKQISNLERGVNVAAHSHTLHRIADALNLAADHRALLESAAFLAGHAAAAHVPPQVLPPRGVSLAAWKSHLALQLLADIAARQAMLVALLTADVTDVSGDPTAPESAFGTGGLTSDNPSFQFLPPISS